MPSKNDQNTFGETLRFYRDKIKWTQDRLGAVLNPPRGKDFISEIEKDKKKARPPLTSSEICALAKALKVQPQILLVPYIQKYDVIVVDGAASVDQGNKLYTLAEAIAVWHADSDELKGFLRNRAMGAMDK